MIDLRLGDWRTALADVERVDCVITDPPYGSRTHVGQFDHDFLGSEIAYQSWAPSDVCAFIAAWSKRCSGWFCAMTSHDLITAWESGYRAAGLYPFAPVPILQHRPRLAGDGPGSGAVHLMVARPRRKEFMSWGSLPCWYESQPDKTGIVVGAKPLSLMRAIVRDYSKPGDLICDPCAGGATTLIAAAMEGRRAVGSELDPETYRKAKARIARGHNMPLFVS